MAGPGTAFRDVRTIQVKSDRRCLCVQKDNGDDEDEDADEDEDEDEASGVGKYMRRLRNGSVRNRHWRTLFI
jgi:hypothetical protein